MRKLVLPLLLVGLMTTFASAELVTVLYNTPVNASDAAYAPIPGYTINDLVVDLGTDGFLSAELLVQTGVGMIFQDPAGSDTPPTWPNIAPQSTVPPPQTDYLTAGKTAYYDTYVSGGTLSWATYYKAGFPATGVGATGAAAGIVGGAVDIGGAGGSTFSDSKVDVAWYPVVPEGQPNPSGVLKIARVMISNEAQGAWSMRIGYGTAAQGDQHFLILSGQLVDAGHMIVPEPSTVILLICGALSLLAFRRR